MLILRLSKREDQALIPISTILKFSAQKTFCGSTTFGLHMVETRYYLINAKMIT